MVWRIDEKELGICSIRGGWFFDHFSKIEKIKIVFVGEIDRVRCKVWLEMGMEVGLEIFVLLTFFFF